MAVVHLTLNLRDMAYLPARVDGVVLVWGSRLFGYQGAPHEGRFGIFRGFLLVTVTVTISRRVPVIVVGKRRSCVRAWPPGTGGNTGSNVEEYCEDTSWAAGSMSTRASASGTILRGRWLFAVREAWIIIAALTFGVFVASIPGYFSS